MTRPEDIQEQLSAYVDGQLPAEEARRVEQAIQADESLALEVAAIRATRDVLRAEKTLSPSADFVDRVVAEALRRNLIAPPQPAIAVAAGGAAAAQAAGRPAPSKRWQASWPVRLAAAASLVLAVAAGGTVAVLYWTNYPRATSPVAATGGATHTAPGGAAAPLPADDEGRARDRAEKRAPSQDYRRQSDGGWVYPEKDAADRPTPAKPMPEEPAAAKQRPEPVEAKGQRQLKESLKEDYYYANAKAIVRNLAGEAKASGLAGRRGGNAKNAATNDLAVNDEEASGEAVQKLDLHVTHLAAARREVAAILTAAASPAAAGGPTKAKASADKIAAAPTAVPAEMPARSMLSGPAKPGADGGGLAPTAAPPAVGASRTAGATATPTDGKESTVLADRTGMADKLKVAATATQRASALASLRGMACEGSAGSGVWKFVIVDTPERIDRISQAVRRVGVTDHDTMSDQRLCVAEPDPSQTRPAGPLTSSARTTPPAKGSAATMPRPDGGGQAQPAPYHVAEIQRRPEPRAAEPLRLLIITLRAEPAPTTSNANPDRNLGK